MIRIEHVNQRQAEQLAGSRIRRHRTDDDLAECARKSLVSPRSLQMPSRAFTGNTVGAFLICSGRADEIRRNSPPPKPATTRPGAYLPGAARGAEVSRASIAIHQTAMKASISITTSGALRAPISADGRQPLTVSRPQLCSPKARPPSRRYPHLTLCGLDKSLHGLRSKTCVGIGP